MFPGALAPSVVPFPLVYEVTGQPASDVMMKVRDSLVGGLMEMRYAKDQGMLYRTNLIYASGDGCDKHWDIKSPII